MAQNTIYSVSGFLPYGVSDDSIIFRSSLTSEASFTSPEIGGADTALTVNAGGSFDSTLGYNPLDTGTLFINDLTNYATCENGFQMSFQVSRDWVCPPVNDTTNGVVSGGDTLTDATGEECFISALGTSGYAKFAVRHIATNTIRIVNPDATLTGLFAYSQGKDDYVTINIGHSGGYGGRMSIAVDGCVLGSIVGNDSTTADDILRDIYIGSQGNTNRHVANHYIRNFQISNRPPCFPAHPKLAKIAILSDSMFNSDDVSGSNHKDVQASWTIRRELAKKGIYCSDHMDTSESGAIHVSINSGDTWAARAGGADDLQDQTTAILAEKPNIVVIRGGTNDIVNDLTIDSSWDAEIKAHCDALLAADSVQYVIVGTIPSLIGDSAEHTAAKIAARDQANTYIRALNAYDSRIIVADCFTDMGGDSPLANTFKGQISGYINENSDLHAAGLGHYLMGKSYADAIKKVLG